MWIMKVWAWLHNICIWTVLVTHFAFGWLWERFPKYQNYDCTSFACPFFTWLLAEMGQNISLHDLPHRYTKCFSHSPFSFLLETDVFKMLVLRSKSLCGKYEYAICFISSCRIWSVSSFEKMSYECCLKGFPYFFIAVFGPWFKSVDFVCKLIC